MKKLYSLLLFIVFGILSSNAQVIDETFVQPTPYKAAKITVIKELSDGKILLGGNIQFYKEKKVGNLIRLNADYSLDESFVFNGDPKSEIKDVKFQSNGNIIVLTTKDNLGLADYFKLYQLNANGETLKEVNTIFNATAIAVQADDKILVTGGAIGYYDFTSCYLNRFNSDFSLDETFKNDLAFNGSTNNVVVSSNGIYVGGTFTAVDGIAKNSLIKLNSDGILDTTFDVGEGTKGQLFSLTLQDDGKLLIGRHFSRIIDTQPINNMCRLNPDGTIDETFNTYYFSFHASTIVVKDSFIYFGMFEPAEFNSYIAKLNPDGTLNQNFTLGRLNENGEMFFTLGIVGDKIIYNNSGNVGNKYGLSVCDFNGNRLDSSPLKAIQYGSFDKGEYFDGKLVIKGDFVRVNDVETFGIALLNANGSVDESFVFPKYIGDVTQFQVIDNTTIFVSAKKKLLKLNNKGEVLKDFDFSDIYLTSVKKFRVLANGEVLFSDENGLYKELNTGGHIPYSLKSETYRWFTGVNFEVQDDKIIFTAVYNDYDHYDYKFLRFNLDNTVDETFKINGSGPDTTVNKIKVLESGEIIAAGDFLNFNGVSVPNQIVKISKDGNVDLQFIENQKAQKIGISTYHDYRKIEQVGDVIYITEGNADVTAINLDGTFVKNFEMPSVIDNITDLVALENKEQTSPTGRKTALEDSADKYMFAMGTIKNATGASSVVVKVNLGKSSGSLSVGPTPEKLASKVQVFPVPVHERMSLSFTNSIVPNKISVYSVNGQELYSAKVQSTDNLEVDMSKFTPGVYFIKLFSDSGVITKKVVKK
ncbi:putative delta-60 repeat protein/predicted secreted protein (Por secretion system target) [Flavobacterium sp. 90]|uniref:T9SS type A sorting domain-containing protein n=1 Tax=unclassified Flavobacterium TaxID=196869 RepID=UPI000EAD2C25|nr:MULTISPECIES: T9SS type A sorting domain-containing protein [unclassified Flavobacterium]RKR08496.1 putative delta-60 repeat protein/predicted secreted protein (Por secretion system target) [Flavobacterium sp. 81]TCK52290.1 putative delta-60 repeat protein/predicted secreted protein (Por secretion system target) [Flavobacterium sp. 90]